MTNPPPIASTSTASPKPRKRGRWWKILLSLVILLLLFVLILPTLLSTGLGKSFLLSQINAHMPGKKLNAESISLGWFSGFSIDKLDMIDANQKPVISLDHLDTGVTLWNVVAGSVIDLKNVAISGGKLPQLPGTTITIHLVGTADLSKKIINITDTSTISALDDKTKTGTVITLEPKGKFSWGTEGGDAGIFLEYDLAQIQAIFGADLPTGTVLAGARKEHYHVTGSLTSDPGMRAIRGITVDPAFVGFDQVSSEGVVMGKADIGFKMEKGVLTFTPTPIPTNGGTLTVQGKVDFNQDPPAYIIDKNSAGNSLVKGIELNKAITAGPLAFLPINWGANGNLAEVTGQANVNLFEAYIPLDSEAYKTKGTISGTLSITNLATDIPFLDEVTKKLGPVPPNLLAIKGGSIPDVPFNLTNGKVSYQNLRLGTALANLTFSGSVGLDTSLAMSMDLKVGQMAVPIPVGLKGTTAKPEITLNGKLPDLGNLQDLGKDLGNTIKSAPDLLKGFDKKK